MKLACPNGAVIVTGIRLLVYRMPVTYLCVIIHTTAASDLIHII